MALPFEYNMCWVVMSILSGNAFGVYNHLHFFFFFFVQNIYFVQEQHHLSLVCTESYTVAKSCNETGQ